MSLRENANKIMSAALCAAMPDTAVRAALDDIRSNDTEK